MARRCSRWTLASCSTRTTRCAKNLRLSVVADPDLLDVANTVPPHWQSFNVRRERFMSEFDFHAGGDSISFNYVFGSDEYPAYVNTQYNDIFAFFLSGPGITGPMLLS